MKVPEFCPSGHAWIEVKNTTLFENCHYCKKCDKVFVMSPREVTKEWFAENFSSPRFDEIKRLAQRIEALKKVTNSDLEFMGYLDKTP